MADANEKEENVDSMETDSASEGKAETPPKRPDNLCCYSQKECDLEKLKGFDFCHKHILEDHASPFKPCDFVSKTNGEKCTQPAPKLPDGQKTYCLIHTRDSELRKILEAKNKKKKRKLSGQQDEHARPPTKAGPGRPAGVRTYTKRPKVIDLGAEYRRDDVLRVESSWHGDYESDSESLDNDVDDTLRHAGVWTAEEVTKMCRDKLLRLRSLYMSQFERLKHVYKNKRRKYLLATSANEEDLTAVRASRPNDPVSALHIASRSYNKRYRTDALLQKQSKEKRLGTATRNQTLPHQRCTQYTDGNRCTSKIVPFAKFCLKHICYDPNQQLFLPCSQMISADQNCGVSIPNVSNHERCLLHLPHSNHGSVGDLEQELEHAQQRQIIKEKEREDKQKAALAQAAHEARLSEIAKAEAVAAQQAQKTAEDATASAVTQGTVKKQEDSNSAFNAQQKESSTTADLPLKLSGSPTTNLQIKIQPKKQPEIVSKALPSTVGNVVTSSTSTTDTVMETTSQSHSANSSSIPSKIQPGNAVTSHLPVKPSGKINTTDPAVDQKQTYSSSKTSSATPEITSVLPTTKEILPVDTSDQGSSLRNNVPAKQDAPKATNESMKTNTSKMDVGM